MKRILIALAMLAAVQVAVAQVKSPDAAGKAVAKAETAANDAKKATKVATWITLGKAYMDAYNAPAGSAWVGAARQELTLLMGADKPQGEQQVELNGTPYIKEGDSIAAVSVVNKSEEDTPEQPAEGAQETPAPEQTNK